LWDWRNGISFSIDILIVAQYDERKANSILFTKLGPKEATMTIKLYRMGVSYVISPGIGTSANYAPRNYAGYKARKGPHHPPASALVNSDGAKQRTCSIMTSMVSSSSISS